MAIQFLCTACRQPIEVDDNMANLAVTCPYCRQVVAAPSITTLAPPGTVPPAAPGPAAAQPSPVPYAGAALPPPAKRAVLGWIALVLMALSVLGSVAGLRSVGTLLTGINLQPKTEQETRETQEAMRTRVQQRPGPVLIACASFCPLPLAGLICAIVALVKRSQPRWPAIVALCLVGVLLLCCLSSGYLSGLGTGIGGG